MTLTHTPKQIRSTRRARKLGAFALCAVAALCVAASLIGGCSTLPSLENRTISTTLPATADTRLGRAVMPRVDAHPGLCGIYALTEAREAFAARMLLANAAERSLDVQYYIWRKDMSGTLMFDALRSAADRGVRVRLLLDDNNTSGLDALLAGLDRHPNIEIRLFNPFIIRSPRALGFLTDFPRLNRRMHNKSFTADNQVTIIGGRNVGDEYFDATTGVAFVDLDVVAIGPVVQEVSSDFDRYWASDSSYPVDRILPADDAVGLEQLAASARQTELDPAAAEYLQAVRGSGFVRDLMGGNLSWEWAATRMISDDPAKGLDRSPPEAGVPAKLRVVLGEPVTKLELVSPYFVVTGVAADWFVGIAERGARVRVLTNSLEATDVAAVHAGYAKRRKRLLRAGVTLYESRRELADAPATQGGFVPGSSASSLHAKTFALDDARVFIGSFNFDPRSARLNTEMGFLIESPALARRTAEVFDSRVPMRAYEVRLTDTGDLYWLERRGAELVRHDTEPGTNVWQRAGVRLLSLLPIDWLL